MPLERLYLFSFFPFFLFFSPFGGEGEGEEEGKGFLAEENLPARRECLWLGVGSKSKPKNLFLHFLEFSKPNQPFL